MMPQRDSDQPSDPAVAAMSLATEAALLEARLRMLQDEIDTVDARIAAVSDALRLLRRAPSATAQGTDSEDHRTSPGQKNAGGLTDEASPEWSRGSLPCWP